VDGDTVTIEKTWDPAPGSERGFVTSRPASTIDLAFDVWLAPGSCFLAKVHQADQKDQATNSYHLHSDDRVSYLARHHHVFTTVAMARSAWTPVRLTCTDGVISAAIGGRPVVKVRDRLLTGGYAFIGLKGGRARLRRVSVGDASPLRLVGAARGPAFRVLRKASRAGRPVVSIVTTVYDRVECLRHCIRSVKRLNYADFEHIVVADAPPPVVLEAIGQVATDEGDERLHLLALAQRANDWGITPAAVGLRQASGDFVCFLSDDNGYTPDHVTGLLAVLEREPRLGFAYSSCAYAGRLVLRHPVPCGGRIDLGQPMFRRELFSTYLDDDLPFNQLAWDWALIDTLMKHGVKWRHVDRPTFIFRLAQYPRLMPR
jgi:hypothetical protein